MLFFWRACINAFLLTGIHFLCWSLVDKNSADLLHKKIPHFKIILSIASKVLWYIFDTNGEQKWIIILGHEAKIVYKRLASLLSTKWERPYSSVLTWIRCCLSFSLLRSSIRCIRGYRSKCGFPVRVRLSAPIDVVNSETGLWLILVLSIHIFNCLIHILKLPYPPWTKTLPIIVFYYYKINSYYTVYHDHNYTSTSFLVIRS